MSTTTPVRDADPAFKEALAKFKAGTAAPAAPAPAPTTPTKVLVTEEKPKPKPKRFSSFRNKWNELTTQDQNGTKVQHWSFFPHLIMIGIGVLVGLWLLFAFTVFGPATYPWFTAVGRHMVWMIVLTAIVIAVSIVLVRYVIVKPARDRRNYYQFDTPKSDPLP